MSNQRTYRSSLLGIHGRASVVALAWAIILVLAVLASGSAQAQNVFTTFNVTGAGTTALSGTGGISINDAGVIAGIYVATGNVAHGFVRAADGTITTFDATGAGTSSKQGTFPFSINAGGDITGMYADGNNKYHGFVRVAAGTITTFDVPGAGSSGHAGTIPMSINASGTITGMYEDANQVYHGFIRTAAGTITTFSYTGAGTGLYQGTNPMGINAGGDIVGYYRDANYTSHGFVRAASGTITTFDVSGATGSGDYHGVHGTFPISINTTGVIAGTYSDASGLYHGFVRAASGTISTFVVAAAGTTVVQRLNLGGTSGVSINDAGNIAGLYFDGNSTVFGFVRTAADGSINTLVAPGAGTVAALFPSGTAGFSINSSGAVAGAYLDNSSVLHGFTSTPAPAGTFTVTTQSTWQVTHGSSSQLPVTLTGVPSGATVSVTCVNLPAGASCSYSNGNVTFTASNTTPTGTYSIVMVFTVTPQTSAMLNRGHMLAAALGLFSVPLGLLWMGRRRAALRVGLIVLIVLALLWALAGCGGSNSSQTPSQMTGTTQSSAPLNLTIN